MTNNVALPRVQPETGEEMASRLLSSSTGNALTISRSTSGDWILTPASDLTSEKLRHGLAVLDRALAGGPEQRIKMALTDLIAVTRRPSTMDDEKAKRYFMLITEAMLDYPVDIVEQALAQWRKSDQGEWWPAEAELRRVCEKLFEPRKLLRGHALRMLLALEQEEERAEKASRPSYFPGDKHRTFKEAMRKRMSPARFDCYFHPSQIKYVGETVMLVRAPMNDTILIREGKDLVEKLGLTIKYDPMAFIHEPPRPWEETTEAEHAEITRKLQRLFEAMKVGGQEIARLRREGVL